MQWIALLVLGLALTGCRDCPQVEADAVARVLASVPELTPCDFASECTVVALSGTCFDGCSMIAHVDDAVVYRTTMQEIEADTCSEFDDGQCEPTPSPCPEPGVPTCLNRQCLPGVPDGRAMP